MTTTITGEHQGQRTDTTKVTASGMLPEEPDALRRTYGTPMPTPRVMRRMAGQMLPLASIELKAIVCGSLGHLSAIWTVMLAAAGLAGAFTGASTAVWVAALAAAVVLAFVRGPLAYGEQLFNHQMAFSVLRDIRGEVFDRMRALAPAKLRRQGRGNLVTVITQDIELLEIFYAHTLSPIAIAAITTVVNVVVFWTFSPWLGLTALVADLLLVLLVPLLTAGPTYRAASAERAATGALHSLVLESLDGRDQLAGLGAAARTRERLMAATTRMIDARGRSNRARGWNDVITETIPMLAVAAFTGTAAVLVSSGGLGAISAIVAVAGFTASFPALMSVARLGSGLQPTLASARRVFALMDEEPAVKENEGGRTPGSFTGLDARHLAFSYADDADAHADAVLADVDLSIRPGDVIAVQGENGAGKSTLIDVLMRFRDRTDGTLDVSGESIETIDVHALRRLETMVSQDTFLFDDTVARNIAIARPKAARTDIEAAARDAGLDDVLAELPGGLDHRLTRNGSELSEGQRQRIAVARAFLSDAPLVLLDEPTSNMDALLEGRVLDALFRHRDGRAYLIVSHRSAAIARADRLLTLRDGRLVEDDAQA